MCGIFGLVTGTKNRLRKDQLEAIIRDLFVFSESRGKEASGFAGINGDSIIVHKTPFPASKMVKTSLFKENLREFAIKRSGFFALIGHSRLVTNGYEHFSYNNQPIVKENMVGVHNGIIVNVDSLWKKYNTKLKETDLDTEIIPVIIRKKYQEEGNLSKTVMSLFHEIYGMTNIAFFLKEFNNLLLATNNGSIYYIHDKENQLFVFASEHYILDQLIQKHKYLNETGSLSIVQLKTRTGLSVSLNDVFPELKNLNLDHSEFSNLKDGYIERTLVEVGVEDRKRKITRNTSLEHRAVDPPREFVQEHEGRKERIKYLKRCNRCILPETFPFIEFDENGVCNYCLHHKKIELKGASSLMDELEVYKSHKERPNVLMPFSGGRDSSFSLHYVVKELGMKPIAFSYDWGMITDLARRNQARMCDKLGVEHILVSADIRKKRDNIRKNVLAWLKRPSLGTIPLFMAGDKQYFHFANLLMEQNNLKVSILGENLLETTTFKSGFCGIKPKFDKKHTYSLTLADKLKMLSFYGKEFLLNPSYLNSSLLDTLDAFKSYYVIKHRNINLFNYIKWDEKLITDVLINEYDWETDPGTRTTWRIGDGTAAFYNYIYYMIAGFTENDTFRSNQVREGDLTREEALKLSIKENEPRWDSMKWYCKTINIELDLSIKKINSIKTLY